MGILQRRNENTRSKCKEQFGDICKNLQGATSRAVLTVIFTNAVSIFSPLWPTRIEGFRENCAAADISEPGHVRAAPGLQHPPVNHLHSIENPTDTASAFSLTLEMKRVKRQSFFDSF